MLTSKTFVSLLRTSLIPFLIFFSFASYAQHDSLILKTGDVIVGEIKSLDKGVVTIETDYSKSDFTIEWSGIKEIYSNTPFLMTLKNGERITGTFHSVDTTVIIKSSDGKKINTVIDDIVYLKGLKSNFWSRAHASEQYAEKQVLKVRTRPARLQKIAGRLEVFASCSLQSSARAAGATMPSMARRQA